MTTALWKVSCVPLREVKRVDHRPRIVGTDTWKALAVEIALRLERTDRREALRYEFHDAELARRAAWGIRVHFAPGQMKSLRSHNILYVYRGPQYRKGENLR